MILLLVPASPAPDPTIVQSVITPHPVKFIVGMMYCVLEGRVPVPVPSDGAGGIEGASQVPIKMTAKSKKNPYFTKSEDNGV